MACETISKQINGEQWSVTQMSATRALALETKLAPVLLQGAVPVLAVLGKSNEDQSAVLSQAIAAMMKSLPAEEMAEIIKDLCEQCYRNGKGVNFEQDFSGADGVLLRYQVAWFVLDTNFAGFFGALLPDGVLDRARAKFDETMSQAESTGESGDLASQSPLSAA